MATKMVANFKRSLSFPNHPSSASKPKKTFHVRSTSLPCRSHPLISQVKDEINELKSFVTKPGNRSSAWLYKCISQLKIVHESLDDVLQLPQTRESLSGHVQLIEKFLEDFLCFVDVYGMFQTLVLTLKEEHLSAQVALRRRDDSKMALYVKGLKKIGKEMDKLVAIVESMGKYYSMPASASSSSSSSVLDVDAELCEAIKDAVEVTVLVSVAVFNGLSISLALRKPAWMGLAMAKKKAKKVKAEEGIQEFQQFGFEKLLGLSKKGEEEVKMVSKRMHDLEDCIVGIESGSEKVFRSLINARVSLLNVLT